MSPSRKRYLFFAQLFTAALGVLLVLHGDAWAGEVEIQVSDEETYVGVPIDVTIVMSNFAEHEPPQIADIDGLLVEASPGNPEVFRQITVIQGKPSRSTSSIYRFSIIPQKAGSFTIPPIPIKGDGEATITRAIRIRATKSETEDLIFATVTSAQTDCFVGQPIELTLTIDVLPYVDPQLNVKLTATNHWQLFANTARWGVFSDALEEMISRRQFPSGQPVERQNRSGETSTYYRYQIKTEMYPDRPGPIALDDLAIITNYPMKLARRRGLFGGSLFEGTPFSGMEDDFFGSRNRFEVAKFQRIVTEAELPGVEVKPIPTQDAPSDYRGAVGRYTIDSAASPIEVEAGEPIELQIVIQSTQRDTASMNLVQPPPLAVLETFAQDFKVSGESMGGLVEGNTKLFQTTIRPLSAAVTEIPPIPLTFFDPDQKIFETVYSDPIKITVSESEVLSLSSLGGSDSLPSNRRSISNSEPTEESPSFTDNSPNQPQRLVSAEYQAIERLRQTSFAFSNTPRQTFSAAWFWWCLISFPAAAISAIVWISCRSRLNWGVSKRLSHQINQSQETFEIQELVANYLSRLMKISPAPSPGFSKHPGDVIVGEMRKRGLRNLANQCERIFSISQSSLVVPQSLDEYKQQMHAFLRDVDAHRVKLARIQPNQFKHASTAVLFALFATVVASPTMASDNRPTTSQKKPRQALDDDQKRALLTDTLLRMERAIESTDPTERQSEFRAAADQFRALRLEGLISPQTLILAARCHRELGKPAFAMADYLHAAAMDPENFEVRKAMAATSQALSVGQHYCFLPNAITSWTFFAPARFWAFLAVFCWAVMWTAVAMHWTGTKTRFKTVFVVSLLGACFATAIWFDRNLPLTFDQHAVVASNLDLRSGDADDFAVVHPQAALTGQIVQVLRVRGAWSQVVAAGIVGWERNEKLAPIG